MAERKASSSRRSPATVSTVDDAYRAAEVCEVVNQLREDFQGRDALYRTIETAIHSEYRLNVPKAYETTAMQIRTPLALNVVNTVTAALSVNPPSVNCEPLTRGLKGQQNAEKREHFFEASWARQESDSRRPLLRLFMGSLVAKGEGILKTVERSKGAWGEYRARSRKLLDELDGLGDGYDQDAKDRYYDETTEEYKKAAPYPIVTTDVPPEQFYYWRNEDGFTCCAEVSEVPYLEALDRYGQGLDRSGGVVPRAFALPRNEWQAVMGNTRVLRRVEYWDWKECFPGEVRVAVDSRLRRVMRRWYEGQAVTMETASGYQLTGTPNHPVLTDRGWTALGSLQEGDRVISRRGLQQIPAVDPDAMHPDPTLREVFDLAQQFGTTVRLAGAEGDFHGDGQDGDVDVVAVDGELWDRIQAALAQPALENDLPLPAEFQRLLAPDGRGVPVGVGPGGAPDGFVRGPRLAPVLLGSRPGEPQGASLGAAPQRDADSAQAHHDRGGVGVQVLSDPGRRVEEFDVAPDEIVSIERRTIAAHVYNLETDSHIYSANRIIAHNCCILLSGPGQFRRERKTTGGQTVKRITNHGYGNQWTKTLNGPYFHAQGIVTPSRLPEKAGLGVLYGFLSLFPALDTYLTIQSNSAYMTGFAAFRRRTPPGSMVPGIPPGQLGAAGGTPGAGSGGLDFDAGDLQSRERIEPGYVYPYDVEALEMPKSGPDLDKVILAIRAMIEIALPSVVSGVISGDESGYALNQAAHLARLAWDPIVRNAERALGERVSWESYLIERKIKEPVYAFGDSPGAGTRPVLLGRSRMAANDTARSVRAARQSWLAIGPEDLNGYHRYTVRLDPETPSNRVIEVRTHTEMVTQGFETRAQAIEALGGDPAEVQRGRMVEALMEDPEIVAKLRQRTFQRLGIITQDEAQKAQQGAQQLIPAGATMSNGVPEGFEAGAPDVFQPGQASAPLMNQSGGPASAPGNAGRPPGPGSGGLGNTAPRPQVPGTPTRHVPLPGQ